MKYSVGIDEVGRGPLAGPVTVCALQWISDCSPYDVLKGVKDSKKLSPSKRIEWFNRLDELKDFIHFQIYSVSPSVIDKIGISKALSIASSKALSLIDKKNNIEYIYSDYGIPIPDTYDFIHIVKGDEKNPLISLASILAKVHRDEYMSKLDSEFDVYGFKRNKGYGTKEHRNAIYKHGPSSEHRMTFLRNIVP